jgi:hypothetical protein
MGGRVTVVRGTVTQSVATTQSADHRLGLAAGQTGKRSVPALSDPLAGSSSAPALPDPFETPGGDFLAVGLFPRARFGTRRSRRPERGRGRPIAECERAGRTGAARIAQLTRGRWRWPGPARRGTGDRTARRSLRSTAMVVLMHYAATAVLEVRGSPQVRTSIGRGRHLSTLAFSETVPAAISGCRSVPPSRTRARSPWTGRKGGSPRLGKPTATCGPAARSGTAARWPCGMSRARLLA